MRNFKNLEIWQRSMELVKSVYVESRNFPPEERFGLQSQLRRAVTSIPINIAEGCGRDSSKDFAHFLHIAEGSASEVECELLLSVKLGFMTQEQVTPLIQELNQISRMMNSYSNKVKDDF